MRKLYLTFLFFVFAGFVLQAQTTIYDYNFDGYTVGQGIALQAGDPWTTWSEAPGGPEDPLVSDAQSSSPSNSIHITTGNDCVLLLGDETSGRYKISFQLYIPSGGVAYYNVLQAFAGTDSEWGTQLYFDNGGEGSIDAGAEGAATFTYNYDEWILIENYVDLDNDWAEVFIGGEYLIGWQWTLGTFGTPGPLQLGGVNIYAWEETGTPDFYVDNMLFEEMPLGDPPQNLTADVSGDMVDLEWEAPASGSPVEYYVYRNYDLLGITTEMTFSDVIEFPGTYTYAVKAYYVLNGLSAFSNEMMTEVEGGVDRTTVLFEIATGTWCFYCPGSAMGADEMVENGLDVSIIEYHIGDDYENDYSVDRDAYYSVPGYPTTRIDGSIEYVGGSNTESLYDTYLGYYNTEVAVPSIFSLEVEATAVAGETYMFNVNVMSEQLWSYTAGDLRLQVAVTESHIPDNWQDPTWGMTEVNFVLREMYPNAFGTALTMENVGDMDEIPLEVEVSDSYMIENCELVVFIQDANTKEVMNSYSVNLGQVVGVAEMGEQYSRIYPNPATDKVSIESESTLKNISIFNINGQKVYEMALDQNNVDLNVDQLETGIYMIRLETESGSKVEKLNIR